MDVSTDGFSKLLLKSSLLLCTYLTWLLRGTRKTPREVTCSQQGGDQLRSAPVAVGQGRRGWWGCLWGAWGAVSCQQWWGSSGVLGVAHRAALALVLQAGDAEAKGVPAGDHIAELQVVSKSWAFGNSTIAYWCLSFRAFAVSEGALTHFLIHQRINVTCGNNSNNPGGRCPSYGVTKGRDGIRKADRVKIQLVPFQRHSPSSVS